MAAVSKSSSPKPPPPPGDGPFIHPDHAPATASAPHTTATTITNDLFKFKISTNVPHDLNNIQPSTTKSDDLPKAKPPTKKPTDDKKCTNCGKMGAKAHCTGCHLAPEPDGTLQTSVRYCNKECQKAHWVHHRRGCKQIQARKALFRAGRLLQEIWYTVRQESFDNAIVRVQEVDGDLVVYDGDYNFEPTLRKDGYYRKFPDHVFKNKKDSESCLSLLFCNECLSHMYGITEWLLKGLCTEITEVMVKTIKPARKARFADDIFHLYYTHVVVKVVLTSGEAYALDLTGAQHGHYEPVVFWAKHMETCVGVDVMDATTNGIRHHNPFDHHARTMLASTFANPNDTRTKMQRAIPVFGECLKLQFNQALEDVKKRYTSGQAFLRLPLPAFEKAQKDMISMAEHVTRDTAEKVDVLLPWIVGEVEQANQMMRQNPQAPKGQLLAYHLVKLAAAFNGAWKRDSETKRLVSLSLERARKDKEFLEKLADGKLPEQKSWSDMTLLYQ